jgi:hypothetical protein
MQNRKLHEKYFYKKGGIVHYKILTNYVVSVVI